MAQLILLNKPFGVLCQFRQVEGRSTLGEFIDRPNVYPAGRLDANSEGLLLLTNDGNLQHLISHPDHKLKKTYWVQVEGAIGDQALKQLRKGVLLNDGPTLPANARRISPPNVWPRDPPIRMREKVPTSWIEIRIREGRNRQVRRMTAAVGFPTLRLIRSQIGQWSLGELQPGQWLALNYRSK